MRASLFLAAALLAAEMAGAAELGTLFTTPAERERLDRLRRGESAQPAAAAAGGVREITGYVKRSDGRDTVWVDGVPMLVASPKGSKTLDPRAVRDYADRDDAALKIERKPPR